jgi:hypothetical protein
VISKQTQEGETMTNADAMKWAAECYERDAINAERIAASKDDEDVTIRPEPLIDQYPEGPVGMVRDDLAPLVAKVESALAEAERDDVAFQDADAERIINARFYARQLMNELMAIGDIDE